MKHFKQDLIQVLGRFHKKHIYVKSIYIMLRYDIISVYWDQRHSYRCSICIRGSLKQSGGPWHLGISEAPLREI